MRNSITLGLATFFCVVGTASAVDFSADAAHKGLVDTFNNRDWDGLRGTLAEDAVFHRANAKEVFVRPDAIVDIFKGTIGAPEQWNVNFAKLDSSGEFVGKDGRVVERGDFAITAGANDDSCYAGSYMMTWVPQPDNSWKLQMLAWQDVETELENCK